MESEGQNNQSIDTQHKVGIVNAKDVDTNSILPHFKLLNVCPDNGMLNEESALAIWVNKSGDREFMEKTKEYNYPELKSLSFVKMGELKIKKDEEHHEINYFMSHCFTRPIRYLQLDAEDMIDIIHYSVGMRPLLALTTHQVLIKKFSIEGTSMKDILESCPQTDRLVFKDCKFGPLDNLVIDEGIDFKIKTLDLFNSILLGEEEGTTEKDIKHLFQEIAKTSMKSSLEQVLTSDKDFPHDGLQKIIAEMGFTAKVSSGEKWPITIDAML